MILALHIAAIDGNPFSVHAVGAEDSEIVCAIGPALVRPQDWMVPEGSPRSHRQCCKWGIPQRELLAAVLRMAECADVFVAYEMEKLDRLLTTWAAADKALQQRVDAWTRPGPERVNLAAAVPVANATDVLWLYLAEKEKGAVA